MLYLNDRHATNAEETINPLTAWLIPSGVLIGSLLGVALIAAISGTSWSGEVTDTVTSEPMPPGMILGASTSQPSAATVAAQTPAAPYAFAFGYLEFDWDLNAPGGVPGFQGWPG